MKKIYTVTMLLSMVILSVDNIYANELPNKKPFLSDRFSYEGHVFLNATKSGIQGERYLLNQQLSNIKLSAKLCLTDWSKIQSLLIYNTLPTPLLPSLYFEQLYIEFNLPQTTKWYLQAGKKWVPFGSYKNDLIYKPLTKALGQTNEYTLVMGYDEFYYANFAFFVPHTRIHSSALPLYFNTNAGIHDKIYDAGLSYIYSIADSQLFQYNKGFGGFLFKNIDSHVPGIAGYVNIQYKQFSTYLTYISAMHAFKANDLSYQNKGATPKAFGFQSGYAFDLKEIPCKIIGFFDYSFQALALQMPEKRIGMGLNLYPLRYLDVQFQVFKDYSYAADISASGLNKNVYGASNISNTFAVQLVLNY